MKRAAKVIKSKSMKRKRSNKNDESGNSDIKPELNDVKPIDSGDLKSTLVDQVKNENIKCDLAVKSVKTFSSGCKLVGAHVSAAGGLENAPIFAAEMGAKSFALFLRSQRTWNCKPLAESTVERFKDECEKHGFSLDAILPHGSYLMNLGAPNPETLRKSREALIDELQRCEKLGITLYNFHPGSTCGKISVDECLDLIAESINLGHSKTKSVVTVVENISKQGNTIGGDFKELRGIIDRVKEKSRMGICIDTCHAFAAGYDVSTEVGFEAMMKEFESVVGLKYLKALHLNDSKGKVGCHLDRHEKIGKGFIGKECFRRIMQDARFNSMPLILETPYTDDDGYAQEIKLLNPLIIL